MRGETADQRGANRARRRALALCAFAALVWVALGVRRLDPSSEIGVLDGLLLAGRPVRVSSAWVVAPPGLLHLSRYPLEGVELPLPGAADIMRATADGRRFGFRGWATVRVRPDQWARLHEAAAGWGIRGALLRAAREAAAGLSPRSGASPWSTTSAAGFEAGFREALARVGLELRRLDVEGLDFLAVAEGSVHQPSTARVLVVGLDGADWAILDPLIEQGRLPNLRRLIENGVRAKLLTISPMLSPVVWTTVATGVEPSRHGVLDFLVDDVEGEGRQPVTSAQRKVPAVWEILSRSGVDVGVTGWWATWPADPVRGYVVSDRIAYQLFGYHTDPAEKQGKTWPPDLYDDLRPLIVEPADVGWDSVVPYLSGERTAAEQFDADGRERLDGLRTLIAAGETYVAVARRMHERFEPRLEIAYFEGTDTVGHLFMPFRPPTLPGVDAGDAEAFAAVVDRYYETADAYLGRLLEGRGDDWTVMVLSDHGFASDATRPRTTDSRIGHGAAADWHRRFGILVLAGAHVRTGANLDEASVYDIAPTLLALFGQPVPQSWPGHVLGSVLDPEFLDHYPVRYRPDDPARDSPRPVTGEDPAAADLLEKLQALGYVSSGSEASESVTARNNAGVAMLAEGRFADAEAEFRAGLAASPGAAMLRFNLGVALRYQGRTKEAVALFEQALEEPTTLRMAGNQLGLLRLSEGALDAAESAVRRVLAAEPEAAEAHNLLGRVLEARGDADGARTQYVRAAELDPDVAWPRNSLGNLAKLEGRVEEAEDWYLRAIEADPYFMGSYNNLALIYQDRGEMDRALDLYGRALAKAPNNAELLNNVGSWYYAGGNFDEARSLWNRAAAAAPDYPSPLNNLAGLAINAQRYDEAERLLRRALDLAPDYGDARINLSIVLRARGDVAGAREQLVRAAADPLSAGRAELQLGFLELEQGMVDRAIAAFESARDAMPGNVQAWNGLGEAYRLAGRTAQAVETWRHSLELQPGQARLRESLEALERLD